MRVREILVCGIIMARTNMNHSDVDTPTCAWTLAQDVSYQLRHVGSAIAHARNAGRTQSV